MVFSQQQLLELEKKVSHLARESAHILKDVWEKEKIVNFKKDFEPVSVFDRQIEDTLRKKLSEILPDSGFIVEEGDSTEKKQYMWAIDPIDGTNNFIGGIPLFFIQIALLHNDISILGVIYNPATQQLFSASAENGARLNGRLIKHHTRESLETAFVDVDFGGKQGVEWKIKVFDALVKKCNRVRASGGSYGPYITLGGIDAFVVLNETTKLVDQAPRIIYMKELGLQVEAFEVKKHKIILTANSILFPQIKEFIKKVIVK